jgi:hypothetical protein
VYFVCHVARMCMLLTFTFKTYMYTDILLNTCDCKFMTIFYFYLKAADQVPNMNIQCILNTHESYHTKQIKKSTM